MDRKESKLNNIYLGLKTYEQSLKKEEQKLEICYNVLNIIENEKSNN